MKTHGVKLIVVALLLIAVIASAWQSAGAYTRVGRWKTNSATYDYCTALPSSYAEAINRAAKTWTDVSTSSWWWKRVCGGPNLLKSGYLDGKAGGALAKTRLVLNTSTGEIAGFTMIFDEKENWYKGTGTPAAGQYDLQAEATHEFGHALGLGEQGSCKGTTSDPTMCQGAKPGTTWRRSLESDDIKGVSSLYP